MGNITSNIKKKADIDAITHDFASVIHYYFLFLKLISVRAVAKHTNDVKREMRKFRAVKKELFDFVVEHRRFFRFKNINLTTKVKKGPFLLTLTLKDLDNFEEFLKLDDVFNFNEKTKVIKETPSIWYRIDPVKKEIIKTLKVALKKSVIAGEDTQLFLENHYLVDQDNVNCSNYKELKAYIRSRIECYHKRKVSTEHINNMTFQFQGPINNFEDEKSCGVCLEDYEEDQKICHLPCNHFCCRSCTEEMFAIPQDGSNAHFQCPICRGDCT